MKRNQGWGLFFASGFWAASVFAMPVEPTVSLDHFSRPMRASSAPGGSMKDVNYEGIVALSNCSGALVRYESSRDDDQGLILTNGHCNETGFIDPNTFLLNEESDRQFAILDPKTGRSLGKVKADKLLYATMTKTDITLYRLKETYRDIAAKFHVRPLTLSSQQAPIGQKIEIISGYWRRGYACEVEYLVDTLKEDRWTMRNSLRYTRPGCQTIHGTSGSPILAAGSDRIIGINNTGNDDGERCTMNNPCEVDGDGKIKAERGVSYGQQIALIYSCLDSEIRIDLKLAKCRLPGGPQAASRSIRVHGGHRRR